MREARENGRLRTGLSARPVHLIITTIKWIQTSRLSIKNSLYAGALPLQLRRDRAAGVPLLPTRERLHAGAGFLLQPVQQL